MILAIAPAWAGDELAAPPESRVVQPEAPVPGGLTFFATFQLKGGASDTASTNPLLDGQVIGDLGGTNGVVVDPTVVSAATEQRANAFFTYRPKLLSGHAALTAAFEIDFAYGDRAYGTGGNTGGGFGGDMVNLQTRRLHADVWAHRGKHDVHGVLGLQFVADGVNDPTAGTPDDLLRSGGRLMFFGSEAAGAAVYGRYRTDFGDRVKWRLGAFTLAEQAMSAPDDVTLLVADAAWAPAYAVQVGAHAWYLQDRSGGTGGALGVGPTSGLSEMQGGPKLDLYDGYPPPEDAAIYADLGWFGVDASYDPRLDLADWGVSGAAFVNVGRLYAPIVHDDRVRGALVDVEGRWRYAPGAGSIARIEATYATGGGDADTYGGVVTGNSYGVAGAFFATHGLLLMFPDPRSINRLTPVLTDASARGRGLLAVTGGVGYDVVRDRVTVGVSGGHAQAADGQAWGDEIDGHVAVVPLPLLEVSAHAGALAPGPASGLTATPWTAYVAVNWVIP